MEVTKDEIIEISEEKVLKCITPFSFIIDINNLKLPLFLYSNYKVEYDENGKKKEFEEYGDSWFDSKNLRRKFYMYNKGRLPRQFEQDVFYGLLGLFVNKNAPFTYNESKHKYEINVSNVEFSWYELCKFIKVECTGYYIEKMKDAIRMLKSTQYFSYEEGVFYDKEFKRYKKSGESGLSLLQGYTFKKTSTSNDSDEYADVNMVIFTDIIINNLRYEYFKFLNLKLYFEIIQSGIERGLYGYLEANRYDNDGKELQYVKRKYEVLGRDLPFEYKYPSDIVRKLEKPLKHLKEIGYLKDFGFGHILKINGQKENCLYFCFGMSMKDVTKVITKKLEKQFKFSIIEDIEETTDDDNESKDKNYLRLPDNDLLTELITKGIEETSARELINKYDKWHIIKYLILTNKKIMDGKINENVAGFLRFAIERPYGLNSNQDIVEFVDNESKVENEKNKQFNDSLESEYEIYVNTTIKDFIENEKDIYNVFYEDTLNELNKTIEKRIEMVKQTKGDTKKLDEFLKLRANSDYFKETLNTTIRLYKNILNLDDFKLKRNNEG